MTPRILLIALSDSLSIARLPKALRDGGFTVGVLCDPSALLARANGVERAIALRAEEVLRGNIDGVVAAIAGFAPRLLLPADAAAARLLHRLDDHPLPYGLREVVRRSLGDRASLPARLDPARLNGLAAEIGLAVVPGAEVASLEAAMAFAAGQPAPVRLRAGETVGQGDLASQWAALTPPQAGRGRMRALLDALCCRRREAAAPSLYAEACPAGRTVCYTASAMDGRIAAGMSIAAEHDASEAGLGAVVRVAADAAAADAASRLVACLGFTGLCGVHFVREPGGRLLLRGFTPYPTEVTHLGRLAGTDPCAGLHEVLTGHPPPRPAPRAGTTVALFPQVWARGGRGPAEHDDIPWEDGGLIAAALGRAAA